MGNGKRKKRNSSRGRFIRMQRRFSVAMYALILAVLCYPWMLIGTERLSLFTFMIRMKRDGIDSLVMQAGMEPNPSYEVGVKVNLVLFLVFAMTSLFYMITIFIRKTGT